MAQDPVLEQIFADLDAAEDTDMRLRVSGEALARLNEQLKQCMNQPEQAVDCAYRILIVADLHARDFIGSDEPEQAPLTLLGELALILTCRVSPEKVPVAYVGSLYRTIEFMMTLLQHTMTTGPDPDTVAHIEASVVELAALTIVTYEDFRKRFNLSFLDHDIRRVRLLLEPAPEDLRCLNGNPINPTMALDVFYDVLARMAACRILDPAMFAE